MPCNGIEDAVFYFLLAFFYFYFAVALKSVIFADVTVRITIYRPAMHKNIMPDQKRQ